MPKKKTLKNKKTSRSTKRTVKPRKAKRIVKRTVKPKTKIVKKKPVKKEAIRKFVKPAPVKPELVVRVYSTPTCPYCVMVKDFLNKHGVVFKDIDVSRNPMAAAEMIQISGQMGVPVVVIGNKVIIGFNKPVIMRELGITE